MAAARNIHSYIHTVRTVNIFLSALPTLFVLLEGEGEAQFGNSDLHRTLLSSREVVTAERGQSPCSYVPNLIT